MHWKYNNYVLKLSMMDPSVCMTATHVTLNFDTFQHTLQFQLMLHALCLIYSNTVKIGFVNYMKLAALLFDFGWRGLQLQLPQQHHL